MSSFVRSPWEEQEGPEDRCYECGAPLPDLVPRLDLGRYNVNSYCCLACEDINRTRSGAGPGYNALANLPPNRWPAAPEPFVNCAVCGLPRRRGTRATFVRDPETPSGVRYCPECLLPTGGR
jgi:hypothetical protein